MPGANDNQDLEPQDAAEAFDEDNYNTDQQLNERRTFEEAPDVLDVTQARGDRDEDEAIALDADEFEPEAFDDELDLEEDDELDYRAGAVEDESDVLGAEGSDEIAGGADPSEARSVSDLDSELEETFPPPDRLPGEGPED